MLHVVGKDRLDPPVRRDRLEISAASALLPLQVLLGITDVHQIGVLGLQQDGRAG
jgi:hypothetical protein